MKGLILETSTEKSCLVLTENEQVQSALFLEGGAPLSRTLGKHVHDLLDGGRPNWIAVGTGPGSFTGIRVGAALAKSLAYAWGIPLRSFCSLQAFRPPNEGPFAVLFDARGGGFYCLRGTSASFEAPKTLSVEEAPVVLADVPTLASPHPGLIQKRILGGRNWIETAPDAPFLAALCHRLEDHSPIDLLSIKY